MSPSTAPAEISIGIVGSGGDGVVLLGELLARSAVAAGLHCYMDKVFGPQIRGGESSVSLRVSSHPVLRSSDELDVLLVFQWSDLARFGDVLSISSTGIVLCPLEDGSDPHACGLPRGFTGELLSLPLKQLALDIGRSKQARNMVMLGAVASLLDWYPDSLTQTLSTKMQRYDERSRENNLAAFKAGGEHASQWRPQFLPALPPGDGSLELQLVSGNEMLSRSALATGCRFMAGYPITPASEILEYMNRRLPALGGTCIQAEDEIGAACLTIGAALGGMRSMSATSGPGMTLKSESIALAGMAQLPMVVVDVQRCGPSTGIPTRTEQSDLNLALYGTHGDSPRIVLAASCAADCAQLATQAFELAGEARAPVILLSEQQIAQGLATVPAGYVPGHDDAGSPGWPTTALGSGSQVQLTGLEHDASGKPLSDAAGHAANMQMRRDAVDSVRGRVPALRDGLSDAGLGLLCWGGGFAVCCEAADGINRHGGSADVLCLRMLAPLDTGEIIHWLDSHRQIVIVEMNHSGQLMQYLRSQLDLPAGLLSLRRSGGRPWRLAEILSFLGEHGLLPEGMEVAR